MVEHKVILRMLKVKDNLRMGIIGLFLGLTADKVLVGVRLFCPHVSGARNTTV